MDGVREKWVFLPSARGGWSRTQEAHISVGEGRGGCRCCGFKVCAMWILIMWGSLKHSYGSFVIEFRGNTAELKCNGDALHAFYELRGLVYKEMERYEGLLDREGNLALINYNQCPTNFWNVHCVVLPHDWYVRASFDLKLQVRTDTSSLVEANDWVGHMAPMNPNHARDLLPAPIILYRWDWD